MSSAIKSFKYTPLQLNALKVGYQLLTIKELTEAFNKEFGLNKTPGQIKSVLMNYKFRSGRNGCFKKGHIPSNKGTKGLTGANSGSFKNGAVPPNLKPIGHERVSAADNMVLIKVNEKNPHNSQKTRYKYKNVHLWEKKNGPLPAASVVRFKDGDNRNFNNENLICISKRLHFRLNQAGYKDTPNELKSLVMSTARLEVEIFKRLENLRN